MAGAQGRGIRTLDASLLKLRAVEAGSVEYEIYRNAVIKGFELTLETAGKLLRQALREYEANARAVDALTPVISISYCAIRLTY